MACNSLSEDAVGFMSDVDVMHVSVKFDSNKTCSIPVRRTTTIGEIKELVGAKADYHLSCMNLVFAGQLLNDNKTVEDYDLGLQTTLHAFCQPTNTTRDSVQPTPSCLDNSRFFVYCKVCADVRPGKLRVCCQLCGSSLFLVEQGPSNWEDISSDTAIRGVCKNEECNGIVPRFYMKCSHVVHGPGDGAGEVTAVALKHIQANRRRVECIICQDVVSPILIFPCPAGHVICLECFREYATTSLSARQFVEHKEFGYTLPCPSGSCTDFHIEDGHHFYLLGKDEYERFKHFGTEEFVLQNGGILCPGPGCGMGLFPEEHDSRAKCTECQFSCCKHCKREFHMGSCEDNLESELASASNLNVDSERAQRASWEMQSLTLIGEISKPCPQCKVKTQRSGGCMHMTCVRCHFDWCWLCGLAWDRQCQENHWFG